MRLFGGFESFFKPWHRSNKADPLSLERWLLLRCGCEHCIAATAFVHCDWTSAVSAMRLRPQHRSNSADPLPLDGLCCCDAVAQHASTAVERLLWTPKTSQQQHASIAVERPVLLRCGGGNGIKTKAPIRCHWPLAVAVRRLRPRQRSNSTRPLALKVELLFLRTFEIFWVFLNFWDSRESLRFVGEDLFVFGFVHVWTYLFCVIFNFYFFAFLSFRKVHFSNLLIFEFFAFALRFWIFKCLNCWIVGFWCFWMFDVLNYCMFEFMNLWLFELLNLFDVLNCWFLLDFNFLFDFYLFQFLNFWIIEFLVCECWNFWTVYLFVDVVILCLLDFV